jgi:hypothetical protein
MAQTTKAQMMGLRSAHRVIHRRPCRHRDMARSPGMLKMGRFSCSRSNIIARRRICLPLGVVAALLFFGFKSNGVLATPPALPAVDMIVQIRLISETELAADEAVIGAPRPAAQGAFSVSNAIDEPASARPQEIRVQNGEHASMSWSQAMPFQWLQAAEVRSRAASATGGGIVNALIWLHAGQSLSVQPTWPGGRQAVRVNIRLETERIDDPQGQDIPSSSVQKSAATLSVSLGRWTTFAATGTAQPPLDQSTWSTQVPRARGRQLMQLRVNPG